MAGVPANASAGVKPVFSAKWIVGPRYDLFFFIGSCVFTFLVLGIYKGLVHLGLPVNGESILITYFIFSAFLDQPHIFQTFSRTHFDRDEFANRPYLYTVGLGTFIGVGFILTGLGYMKQLIIAAAIFGSWHIIRQHWGFIKAYKIRNDDTARVDNLLDGAVFFTGMFACFFNDYSDLKGPTRIYDSLLVQFPDLPADTGWYAWQIFLGIFALFVVRQLHRVSRSEPVNLPKILLMASALTTHYVIFFAMTIPFLIAEALETAFHNVQYQGWMAFYQKRRYPNIKRVALKWFAVSMLYGIVVGAIEIFELLLRPWAVWLFVPFGMLVLFHYYVDGLVWRFRDYPELRRLLFRNGETVKR